MADTFTPKSGYTAQLLFGSDPVNVRGELRCAVTRGVIDISCLGDTFVPFRSFTLGMYDAMTFTVPVPYDPANDAVIALIAASISGTPTSTTISDVAAGTALILGTAIVSFEYAASLDDIQLLNVTFSFTGALTGALVV
jgi:hypothetical protein